MRENTREKLRAFVLDSTESAIADLTDQTHLFENGILKSIQVMDLILFVEEISGQEIDVEGLKPGAFKDIDTIIKNFCENIGEE
jgi:acyl carrier protein